MEPRPVLPDEMVAGLSKAGEGDPLQAAPQLAAVAHKAAAILHGLANREAKRCKGTPDWAKWARLANAARALVLQASTCRDATREL